MLSKNDLIYFGAILFLINNSISAPESETTIEKSIDVARNIYNKLFNEE